MEHPWNSLSNVPEPHLVLCRSGLLDRTGLFDGTHMVWASFCRLHAELIPPLQTTKLVACNPGHCSTACSDRTSITLVKSVQALQAPLQHCT